MRKKSKSPALALTMTDEASQEVKMLGVMIFIASVSSSKSITFFTNCFFNLSRPPGFGRAFDAIKRNGSVGCIRCQRSKESTSRGKRKRRVFLCKWTVKVKVEGKVIPASFLKIKGRGMLMRAIGQREGRIEELVGGQSPGPEAPPRSRKGQERRVQRRCQEWSNCQRSDGEGWVCQDH